MVDSAAYVVRINKADNYGYLTGQKTNCLAVLNVGSPVIEFCHKYSFRKEIKDSIESVFFTRPSDGVFDESTRDFPRIFKIDLSQEILDYQQLKDVRIEYCSRKWYSSLSNLCGPKFIPSSGLVTVSHFVQNESFRDYRISLLGFSWEGWKGHNWRLEREYFQKLANEDRVVILEF